MVKMMIAFLGLFSMIAVLSFIYFLTPSEAGPFGVLVFFTSVFLLFFCIFFHTVSFMRFIFIGKNRNKKIDFCYAAIFAFGFIILMLMRSLGLINFWMVLGLAVFVIFGCFLVKNRLSVIK